MSTGTLYRFPATMTSLPAIHELIGQLASGSGHAVLMRAQTAVEELFANSIHHGYPAPGIGSSVDIGVSVTLEGLRIRYEDWGPAFNPFEGLDEAREQAMQPIELQPVGGLGRLIVHGLADDASYVRDGDRNRIDLLFADRPAD